MSPYQRIVVLLAKLLFSLLLNQYLVFLPFHLVAFLCQDEESANSQHKKIILLLHKLEAGDYDWTKTEKARSDIEDLQCQMVSLKEAISGTCLSILKLRDEELFPQLIEFSVG